MLHLETGLLPYATELQASIEADILALMSESSADRDARRAGPDDAETVARLLHDFNTEFDTPSPGTAILTGRLQSLLAGPSTIAYLAGEPAAGVALVTLRSNVWYDGPVALLDELYVAPDRRGRGLGSAMIHRLIAEAEENGISAIEINVDAGDVDAQRFYERHGFSGADPDTGERAFYFSLEL
ncbi:GNAT family N-acetyltransferase [Agromyces ramosus]|uniref:GNAT family N-acetyltransferase n=1 Tax=Agromyces ramosus TaxID=33879 RepID=UPI003BF8411F